MIVFDRIIASLQHTGGASVLFNELASRMYRDDVRYEEYGYKATEVTRPHFRLLPKRLAERYRRFPTSELAGNASAAVFHSTCYRVPDRRVRATVTTVHDFTYERVIGGLKRLVHSAQKNDAIRRSDLLVCVSHNTRADLLNFVPDVDPRKIVVVHNGVSDRFHPVNEPADRPYVLYVGQRVSYKNFQSLVVALAAMPDLQLRCVGGGSFTEAEQRVLSRLLPGRFLHLGYVDEVSLNRAYAQAFCFAYPSLYEGFGIPILESMRAGCPVVAVNNSSIPEVSGGAATLAEDGSPEALRVAIQALFVSDYRNKVINAGLRHSAGFGWERHYNEMMAAYNKVM